MEILGIIYGTTLGVSEWTGIGSCYGFSVDKNMAWFLKGMGGNHMQRDLEVILRYELD